MSFTNTTVLILWELTGRKEPNKSSFVWSFYHEAPMQIKSPCPLQKHSSYSYLSHVMLSTWYEQAVQRFKKNTLHNNRWDFWSNVMNTGIFVMKQPFFLDFCSAVVVYKRRWLLFQSFQPFRSSTSSKSSDFFSWIQKHGYASDRLLYNKHLHSICIELLTFN